MEVDPQMFGQLQDLDRPFTVNMDPNDWMFDTDMGGLFTPGLMGGMDMGLAGMGGLGGGGMGEYGWQGQASGVSTGGEGR